MRSADGPPLSDGVIRLRAWDMADAQWYADVVANDPQIQRFMSEAPDTTAAQVGEAWPQVAYRWPGREVIERRDVIGGR